MPSADLHIHESLRHLAIRVDELVYDPKNARKHNDRNLAAIRASLERFGFRQPLVVQKQGMIVRTGNGRLQVARELGWASVPCLIVDESEAEATAFALADNRTSDLAEWDSNNLAAILGEIQDVGGSIVDLGWAEHEFAPLIYEPVDDFLEPAVVHAPTSTPKMQSSEIKFSASQWALLVTILGRTPTASNVLAAIKAT